MYIHMYYVYISLLFDDKRLDCGRHLSVFLLAHRAITYIFNNWWSRSECTAHTAHTMACASPMHYSIRLRLLSKIRSWCWRLVHFPNQEKIRGFFFYYSQNWNIHSGGGHYCWCWAFSSSTLLVSRLVYHFSIFVQMIVAQSTARRRQYL